MTKEEKKKLYLYAGIGMGVLGLGFLAYKVGKTSSTTINYSAASAGKQQVTNPVNQLTTGQTTPVNTGVQATNTSVSSTSAALTSEEAKAIQRWLIGKGYDLGASGADGIFGTKSKSAFERATGQAATNATLKQYAYDLMNPVQSSVNAFANAFGFGDVFNGLDGIL